MTGNPVYLAVWWMERVMLAFEWAERRLERACYGFMRWLYRHAADDDEMRRPRQ